MDSKLQHVSAASFKPDCLRLADELAQKPAPIIITKRRKPVAKLAPVDDAPIDPFGCMAGTARICSYLISQIEDIEPTGDAENL
jgi:hypothetical protein